MGLADFLDDLVATRVLCLACTMQIGASFGKQAGYLLVLANDIRGFYEVIFPTNADLKTPYLDDSVLVQAGQKVEVIDLPDRESIKAILFADRNPRLTHTN